MAFKYDITKIHALLESYIALIKDDVSYEMYLVGGGDDPFISIQVDISDDADIYFGITHEEYEDVPAGTFYFDKQDLNTFKTTIEYLKKKKTKKAVKEFMIKMIEQESKKTK